MGRFLKLFTKLPLDEIARLEALGGSEINEAKKTLANEATALLHGRKAADESAETARKTFEEGASAEGLPTFEIDLSKPALACFRQLCSQVSPHPTAMPAAPFRAAAFASTMFW